MILSASRRTDIPAFYSDWLLNRIRAGSVCTRNPFNPNQVRRLSLLPEDVDCFVFWSKNPRPMLDKLDILDRMGYRYYFQYTLNPYGRDLERNLPELSQRVETFLALSGRAGGSRVRWRYDPIILNGVYSAGYHAEQFQDLCRRLGGFTGGVTISFVNLYAKVRTGQIRRPDEDEMLGLAAAFSAIAGQHGLSVAACCEELDLSPFGIRRASCIDKALVEEITGKPLSVGRDRNQRPGCGCVSSVDIGVYNTCGNGCVYCYANHSPASVRRNMARHNLHGEYLID